MKKFWWLIFPILAVVIGVWVYFFPQLELHVNGEELIELDYQQEYIEENAIATVFGFDISDKVVVDGSVNTNVLGEYLVKYEVSFGNVTRSVERKVSVKDLSAPVITPSFEKVVYTLQQEKVVFPYFSANDAYEGDVTTSLTMAKQDMNYIGVHFVPVNASDSSGNIATYLQPLAIYDTFDGVDKSTLPEELETGVYQMKVVDDQLVIRGYAKDVETLSSLYLINEQSKVDVGVQSMSTVQKGYFETKIAFDDLVNGTYQLYYDDQKLYELGAIVDVYRLGRYHIGNKLVSFSYQDGITISVEDFAYVYDIAIDVGHGGIDVGAVGKSVYERDLNLEVSLYEKKRYEEHGLKVWLIREGRDYPELLGEEDWVELQNVSYTLGWYGAVSKYTYSNHHNSDTIGATSGPEIIVVGTATKDELAVEYRLMEEFKTIYPKITTDWLVFTRSYNTASRTNREDGHLVDERVWYGNMRYPYECFGVIVTTYEGAYINNAHDDKWYVKNDGWKTVSEAKIRAYVEALGKEYIPVK